MKQLIIFFIKAYQNCFKSFLPNCCRFHPSCSDYCLESVRRFGVISGMWQGLKRIFRCNPFSRGGYDPVKLKEVD